jgi:hypothetical protein
MNNQPVYWKMRNGKSIDIDAMDLNHLRNTLKMIVRNSQKSKITKEFKLNGDMATEFNESQTCPNCGQMKDSMNCCGFDASELDIY